MMVWVRRGKAACAASFITRMRTASRAIARRPLLGLAQCLCSVAALSTPSPSLAVEAANARAAAHLEALRRRQQAAAVQPPAPIQQSRSVEPVQSADERLCLIDGTNIAYRMFYGMPTLSTTDGRPVNAVLGFCNQLLGLQSQFPGYRMLATFDAAAPTFRADLDPEYKSNRPAAPDDLRTQLASIRAACEAFGVPWVAEPGFEADDLIATACALACERVAAEVVIVSSDKDFMQLITDDGGGGGNSGDESGQASSGGGSTATRVAMYDYKKRLRLDAAHVRAKHGVPPSQFADFLALVGDGSDNVPGVPGIGEKTAAKLLAAHGGQLEGVLAAAEGMKPSKRRTSLLESADRARAARRLVVLGKLPELEARAAQLSGAVPPPPLELPLLRDFLAQHELRALERRLFPARRPPS